MFEILFNLVKSPIFLLQSNRFSRDNLEVFMYCVSSKLLFSHFRNQVVTHRISFFTVWKCEFSFKRCLVDRLVIMIRFSLPSNRKPYKVGDVYRGWWQKFPLVGNNFLIIYIIYFHIYTLTCILTGLAQFCNRREIQFSFVNVLLLLIKLSDRHS